MNARPPHHRDGNFFLTISSILVLDIVFSKIQEGNINKLSRLILKVVIPRIITANTTSKSFEGAMLVC